MSWPTQFDRSRRSVQVVDLEAERSKLRLKLKHARGEIDAKETDRLCDLDRESTDRLKQIVLELENQIGKLPFSNFVHLKKATYTDTHNWQSLEEALHVNV